MKTNYDLEILEELKEQNKKLSLILEAFKSWQSQDEDYHNKTLEVMQNEGNNKHEQKVWKLPGKSFG